MDNLFHRVSVRQFKDQPVEEEKIKEMLHAGMQAPSAGNQRPLVFYVVTNKDTIQALSKVSKHSACAAGAPLIIALACRKEKLSFPEKIQQDMALCAGNVWLEADNLGLGGVYLGVYPEEERMANTRAAIDLPEEYDPFCLLAIGYPARPMRPQQNRFDETRIHYIK